MGLSFPFRLNISHCRNLYGARCSMYLTSLFACPSVITDLGIGLSQFELHTQYHYMVSWNLMICVSHMVLLYWIPSLIRKVSASWWSIIVSNIIKKGNKRKTRFFVFILATFSSKSYVTFFFFFFSFVSFYQICAMIFQIKNMEMIWRCRTFKKIYS